MNSVTNIVIAGVGGQGSILASRLLGRIAINSGFDIKVSEVHGMSQRGGSVITYVRYGEKVYAPLVEEGEADYLIAFEQLEAARWLHMLKNDGIIVMSSQQIDPAPVLSGNAEYPSGISEKLKSTGVKVYEIDAFGIAKELGFVRASNVVILGAFTAVAKLPFDMCKESLESVLASRYVEQNLEAFQRGYNEILAYSYGQT